MAIIALAMSWVIFINFQITQSVERAKEMGLKKAGSAEKMKIFLQVVNQISGIRSSTLTSSIPGRAINFYSNKIFPVNAAEKEGANYGLLTVENHFDEVYQPKLVAGRLFAENDKQGGNLLVINKVDCSQLGFTSPKDAINKLIMSN